MTSSPEVVDDLDGNPARRGPVERPREVASERRPGVLVDLGLEGRFQGLVGVAGAKEVGVADEEALLLVVGCR